MKKRRVIITKLPQAKSGVEVKLDGLRAGLGFNANVMPWPIMAGKMSEPDTEVNKTLKPVPRYMANLEAEKDEIAMIPDKGGIPSTFIIGGKRHHSGGTPLFLPSDSFIFSDTAKMRIKDPTILAQFGMPPKKGGYTPAEIAKKYDISKYKKILADPNTDDLQRETAELMIANNNLKLAKLAIYQESMKGFPQGMPQVGMPYLEEMGVDPAQFVQENPGQGDDETAEADNMSRFGGPLPKAQWGKNTASKMLPKFGEYSPNAGASDAYAGVDTKEGTEGIAGVEGIEGKDLTGKYQDWEMTKKKKAGISGIAKAEGILGGLRLGQAFGNAREMQALDQRMQEGSLYDNAVNPIQQDATGRQGSFVQTGMATGTKDPYNTGNLVQQPGMNYATVKFGGDIDYFAPGGYLPRAQPGITVNDAIMAEVFPEYGQMQTLFGNQQTPMGPGGLGQMIEGRKQYLAARQLGNQKNYEDALKDAEEAAALKQLYSTYNKAVERYNAGDIASTWLDYLPWSENSAEKERKSYKQIAKSLGIDSDLLEADPAFVKGKRYTIDELRKKFAYKAPTPLSNDQTSLAGSIKSNTADTAKVQAAPSSTAAPATTVTTTADAEALKQKEALLKGAAEKTAGESQPAVKKSSGLRKVNIAFNEGGSIGKRRVLIHSLGEYRMGGVLPKAQDGVTTGSTTEGKKIKEWVQGSNGRYAPLYADGTYGPGQDQIPVLVKPYTGADAPSKYTEEEWQEFAKETGFVPQSADPKEQNREFQDHLAKHKDWGPKVDELHKKYGQPKGGKFDALLGKRWDAIVDQRAPKKGVSATPPVKDDKKGTTPTDNNIYTQSLNKPKVPNVPARFTLQDTLKGANLMADYLGIKGSQPWSAKAPVYTPDTAFVSPERQYQKIGEQFSIAAQNLAQSGDPRQYNARLGQLQGQALAAIADTAARTEGENVRIQNVQAAQNANLLNEYGQREAARRTRDYENYVTARDTVDNQKKFARNAGVNQLANAFTNRANIYNINQLYPQYAVDPTGMMYFKNPRDIKPDYTQQKTVNDYFNQILKENENLRNEKGMVIAYDMAKNMAGVKPKTDETDEWLKASKGIIPSYNVNPYGYNNGQGT